MKKVFTMFILLTFMLALTGCGGAKNQFGTFKVGKNYLLSQAKQDLTFSEAKAFIGNLDSKLMSQQVSNLAAVVRPEIEQSDVDWILAKYRGVEINYTYYELDNKKKEGSFIFEGTDFSNYIKDGSIPLFAGVRITDIFMTQDVLDFYEEANTLFKLSPNYNVNPHSNIYTYHKNKDSKFVLSVYDFTEMANTSGYASGYSSTYIKENQFVYSDDKLVTYFQTSQGIKIQYPTNTGLYGTIFYADFNWIEKQ